MVEVKFRWPEEENQHVEPIDSIVRSQKNDDYLDKIPNGLLGMKVPFVQNQLS